MVTSRDIVSKAELEGLIGDYEKAYQMALDVANTLIAREKTARLMLGTYGKTGAPRLITEAANVVTHLYAAKEQLIEIHDNPKLYPPE